MSMLIAVLAGLFWVHCIKVRNQEYSLNKLQEQQTWSYGVEKE